MSNADPGEEERISLERSHPQLYQDLIDLLARHDPIGLIAIGCPRDEYNPEASTILARLEEADSVEHLQRIIYEEFVSWFFEEIAGTYSDYEDLSREAWEMAQEFLGAQKNEG